MEIRIANSHKWEKKVHLDPLSYFGKNAREKLRSTINKIDSFQIQSTIKPVDAEFLDWFLPMYQTRILEKKNPKIFDIKEKTFINPSKQYFSLELYEDNLPLGATIFSISQEGRNFSIAYRTYRKSWLSAKLSANPSLYTEYLAGIAAVERNCELITHGRDRNPYGINSNIGLAAFKLMTGCQPKKSKKYGLELFDTTNIHVDSLVLEYPAEPSMLEIKKAYLLTTEENEHKWEAVKKYPDRLLVETLYR